MTTSLAPSLRRMFHHRRTINILEHGDARGQWFGMGGVGLAEVVGGGEL